MSTHAVSVRATVRSPVIANAIGRLASIIRRFSEYRRRRADIALLRSMTERDLKDIGLCRCDIDFIEDRSR